MKSEYEIEHGFGSTSSTLLEAIVHEDGFAWRRLVRLYAPLVLYWCQRSGLSKEDSFEIGQESFLAIHRSLESFQTDHPDRTFRGWVRVITKRKIADHFRKVSRRLPGESHQFDDMNFLPEAHDPEEVGDEKRLLYQRAMQIIEGEFQSKHQQAFLLLVIEGWRAKDVALRLDMTTNAVYLARHHILRRLKLEFSSLLD